MARRTGDLPAEAIEYGLRFNTDSVTEARITTRVRMDWRRSPTSQRPATDKAIEQQTAVTPVIFAAAENNDGDAMPHAKALGSHPMRAEDFALLQECRRPSQPMARVESDTRIGGDGSAATIYAPKKSTIPQGERDREEGRGDIFQTALRQTGIAVAPDEHLKPASKRKRAVEKAKSLGRREH